jgi:hypothetical protein
LNFQVAKSASNEGLSVGNRIEWVKCGLVDSIAPNKAFRFRKANR